MIDTQEMEERMKHFKRIFREAGVKLTHQRLEIFRELAQSGAHPDADKVFQGVRRRIPSISLDTVYRALWLLSELGLVTTLGSPKERTRFDANLTMHHHFVCRMCGSMHDFHSDALNALTLPESINSVGIVENTHVEVRGICLVCASTEQPPPTPQEDQETKP